MQFNPTHGCLDVDFIEFSGNGSLLDVARLLASLYCFPYKDILTAQCLFPSMLVLLGGVHFTLSLGGFPEHNEAHF